MSVVLFIGVLVLLIVIHELGHFLFAKLFKVRVDEFGIGYPPRAVTLGTRGDTTYTLNWLPFGGFVRIFGERRDVEYSSESAKVAFVKKSRWTQAIILAAGVVFNIVFAWLLFSTALMLGAPSSIAEQDAVGLDTQLVLSSVVAQSPAAAIGLAAGDEIVGIRTSKDALETLTPSAVVAYITERPGRDIVITYIRDEAVGPVDAEPLSPAHGVLPNSPGTPAIGVSMALVAEQSLPLWKAVKQGFTQTIATLVSVSAGLVTFFYAIATGTADWSQVAGPVGIAGLVGDASSVGLVYLMYFTAFISINLAVINLIPLPALDGGRLVFIVVESILRRPIHERTATFLNVLGFTAIVVLMIVVTYKDIVKLIF